MTALATESYEASSEPPNVALLPPAIELKRINKRFGAVHANRDVSLSVAKGTIHGIIGENGAGKSTLMSILYGFYQADSGEILINGNPVEIADSKDAIARGIGMVHQHFMLVDTFTVLENVILGSEGGEVLKAGMDLAREALVRLEEEYDLKVELDRPVGELPVGQQQRVEILKALYRGAEILILDEPTGVLTPQEADDLFQILGGLRDQGKTVILITHKLREIMAITDTVTVMRQGGVVANVATATTSREHLAEMMVGRKVLLRVEKGAAYPTAPQLQVSDLQVLDSKGVRRVRSVGFSVRGGEIVGIAGVSGNGQSELLEALAGIRPFAGGRILFKGTEITPDRSIDPNALRHLSIAHVPEDRLRMGLVKTFTADECAMLGYHDDPAFNPSVLQDRGAITRNCHDLMTAYDVRPPNPALKAANFSGGNQQKLILAREMDRDPDVLLVGQPTRGVDIGAIEFIHRRLIEMRDQGKAILLVSVELDEILSLADRILVMFDGGIVGEVAGNEADERLLGLMMAGVDPRTAASEGQPA